MNGADYLQQHSTESLSFEEMQQINALGAQQQQKDDGGRSAEVQQLLVMKEDPPEWSINLDQQDRESLQIKEEQEDLWTNQEGEQHNGLKVTDVTTFPFTIVTVKSEDDDKEKSQSLQLHQSQTEDNSEMEPLTSSPTKQVKLEPDEEDCGGPESEGNLDTHVYLQPKTDVKVSDSSETEVSNDDDDWKEPVSDSGPKTKDSDDIWKQMSARMLYGKRTETVIVPAHPAISDDDEEEEDDEVADPDFVPQTHNQDIPGPSDMDPSAKRKRIHPAVEVLQDSDSDTYSEGSDDENEQPAPQTTRPSKPSNSTARPTTWHKVDLNNTALPEYQHSPPDYMYYVQAGLQGPWCEWPVFERFQDPGVQEFQ